MSHPDLVKQMGLVEMARSFETEEEYAKEVVKTYGLQHISNIMSLAIARGWAEAQEGMNKVPDFTKSKTPSQRTGKRTVNL